MRARTSGEKKANAIASFDVIDSFKTKGYHTPKRDCDDPYLNFLEIRDNKLWEGLESKRRNPLVCMYCGVEISKTISSDCPSIFHKCHHYINAQ